MHSNWEKYFEDFEIHYLINVPLYIFTTGWCQPMLVKKMGQKVSWQIVTSINEFSLQFKNIRRKFYFHDV